MSRSLWHILHLLATVGLHLQVSGVCRHGEDTEGVGVAEAALPALDGNDRRASLDDVELERRGQTVTDTVVNL